MGFWGTGAHHRAPAVEVELRVVACRGRVGPAEGEEMRGAPEHRLLHRRAPSEAEVVQPRIDQEKLVGVGVGMRGEGVIRVCGVVGVQSLRVGMWVRLAGCFRTQKGLPDQA